MTPKVGDKFKITKSNFYGEAHTEGGIVTFVRNGPGHGLGDFHAASDLVLTFAYEGNEDYPCHVVLYERVPTPKKDPIEYLKTAYADGDLINPETMLRECYGITKTERVVTEWSEVKRKIKKGDRVRLLRGGDEFPLNGYKNGGIYTVDGINRRGEFELSGGEVPQGYARPSSVELV